MRPYLAIIKDSFWEALASRVLWILLILITLVLLALLPLSYRMELTTEFATRDLLTPVELAGLIKSEFEEDKPAPGRRIWAQIDEDTRKTISDNLAKDEEANDRRRNIARALRKGFNELQENQDLYVAEEWESATLSAETEGLLESDPGALSKLQLARRNRMLIEDAYPGHFRPLPDQKLVITYFGAGVIPALPVPKSQVDSIIEQIVIPLMMKFLVGIVMLFAAILVTSPIIPQMFEPGPLHLLLSKPLSRSLMFLSKFVGGCAFILINVAYLIAGLWLIAGVRLGVWNHRLLLCIPVFLFLFSIYYAVSAISGVVWRNAVVSVVMAILLWGLCFGVGLTKNIYEQAAMIPRRLINVQSVGKETFAVNESSTVFRWDATSSDWQEVFPAGGPGLSQVVLGPVYDEESNTVFASHRFRGGFFGTPSLLIARGEEDWEQTDGPGLPQGVIELLREPDGDLLAVTSSDIMRLSPNWEAASGKKMKIFFMDVPTVEGAPLKSVGPRPKFALAEPLAVAMNHDSGELALYGAGRLIVLSRNAKKQYEQRVDRELDIDSTQGVAMAFGGKTLLIAVSDGRLLRLDGESLKTLDELEPEPKSQPRFLSVSSGGQRFAIIFQNGRLHLMDTGKKGKEAMSVPSVEGQGDISAASFSGEHLLVADKARRVSQYDIKTLDRKQVLLPTMPAFEVVYRYGVVVVYTLFPKPSDLDNTIQYILSAKETTDLGIQSADIQAPRANLRPWSPVRSSLAFVVIVLALACIYIERQEF